MFHVEQQLCSENLCETLGILHMERMHRIPGSGSSFDCSTWNMGQLGQVFASEVVFSLPHKLISR